MTLSQSLQQAKMKLAHVSDAPALEAEILLAYVLNQPRSYLYARPEQHLQQDERARYFDYVQRRENHEPIAYLTGHKEFWSLPLKVTRETLIPRPDTECLVQAVLDIADLPKYGKVADLGTGSGAIALALSQERPQWQVFASDKSEVALRVAKQNAKQLGLDRVVFCHGDWCQALSSHDFDVIVSNPPYLAEAEWQENVQGLQFEPKAALVSGIDGLEAIRAISQASTRYLKSGGYLLLEHGFLQGAAVRAILATQGYSHIVSLRDLSGHERVTTGRLL